MNSDIIPFNRPYLTGKELSNISQAYSNSQLAGDGPFSRRCHQWLQKQTGSKSALLTHSCTAALEMAALLLDICPGDEIIMPSYTFVSTANAFVLRGGVPVFVDIRYDTLNINEQLIEVAITSRTKAIVAVHYAGVACEMDSILAVAKRHSVRVVEDAAQGVMARYKGRPLGSLGDLGAYSFHETKNVISGEGGCLLVNNPEWVTRAEILRQKGTDRSRFDRGEVDRYTWRDMGSSFLPGELTAAFLWAQLEEADQITRERVKIWRRYQDLTLTWEEKGVLRRPVVPQDCQHNGHTFFVLLPDGVDRKMVIKGLSDERINAIFHFVPLHSSPYGKARGRTSGPMTNTENLSLRIIRLPLWIGMTNDQQTRVVETLGNMLTRR
ncbi:MAG: dTDP-4-amino-4,6-dideoxygalactose transaminase [Elusimicrobia bacterium]|nr:dTDP-4-amino-4,6-dideoxygalactose transaminase [Elusimicrobiota bacterium]